MKLYKTIVFEGRYKLLGVFQLGVSCASSLVDFPRGIDEQFQNALGRGWTGRNAVG
jgi:hypothetical protein